MDIRSVGYFNSMLESEILKEKEEVKILAGFVNTR